RTFASPSSRCSQVAPPSSCSTNGTPRGTRSTSTTSALARSRSSASAPRVLTASAKTGRNIERLLVEAVALADRRANRVPTPQLNRFLSEVVAARQPPAGGGRSAKGPHRLKLLFMTQTAERPPRFSIQVNSRSRITRDYAYFVENRLRERYRLEGVPVIIDFVERNERRAA
ncbi:MAG TPA: hypothetical protein VGX45_03800, partial [Solirubrobacteraceae bacterium]|nr:hypothetical protein [Solirubrobacteraceae bacterium]